jgi:1-deoxy-D-xylulose-5-phosphate reductoisomerase
MSRDMGQILASADAHALKSSTRRQRRLIVLGSTGSIGVNCLEVVDHLRRNTSFDFEIAGLAVGSNIKLMREQVQRFHVPAVAIANAELAHELPNSTQLFSGSDAALRLIEAIARPGDLVVGAIVGSAGLPAMLAAIEKGCDIALANKETLVAAGALVMPRVKAKGVHLLPIDSEHSAIFQCLESSKHASTKSSNGGNDIDVSNVKRIVITASGGPFRTWSKARLESATVAEALNHPTWNMGPKVTIDSASMMNKALEIIEAHWLFGLPADKIDVIVHPQSIAHSFVEFADNSILAQLGPPDMKTPIQYALTWPDRTAGCSRTMNWTSLRSMDFEPVDHERFGSIKLAYQVIQAGGTAGAIFNAANETAVAAFLEGRTTFGRITALVREALAMIPAAPVHTIDDVMKADGAARQLVSELLADEPAELMMSTGAAGIAPAAND